MLLELRFFCTRARLSACAAFRVCYERAKLKPFIFLQRHGKGIGSNYGREVRNFYSAIALAGCFLHLRRIFSSPHDAASFFDATTLETRYYKGHYSFNEESQLRDTREKERGNFQDILAPFRRVFLIRVYMRMA